MSCLKIRRLHRRLYGRLHRRRIKEQLWDGGDSLSSGYVDALVDQLNSCYDLDGYEAFADLLAHGDLASPEFQPSRRKTGDPYYELAFPVNVDQAAPSDDAERVLAIDAGMRKDVTAVVVTRDGEQLCHDVANQVMALALV